jgi:hypothetical protein
VRQLAAVAVAISRRTRLLSTTSSRDSGIGRPLPGEEVDRLAVLDQQHPFADRLNLAFRQRAAEFERRGPLRPPAC